MKEGRNAVVVAKNMDEKVAFDLQNTCIFFPSRSSVRVGVGPMDPLTDQ